MSSFFTGQGHSVLERVRLLVCLFFSLRLIFERVQELCYSHKEFLCILPIDNCISSSEEADSYLYSQFSLSLIVGTSDFNMSYSVGHFENPYKSTCICRNRNIRMYIFKVRGS